MQYVIGFLFGGYLSNVRPFRCAALNQRCVAKLAPRYLRQGIPSFPPQRTQVRYCNAPAKYVLITGKRTVFGINVQSADSLTANTT